MEKGSLLHIITLIYGIRSILYDRNRGSCEVTLFYEYSIRMVENLSMQFFSRGTLLEKNIIGNRAEVAVGARGYLE